MKKFSNILLLLSAVLLVCNAVLGEQLGRSRHRLLSKSDTAPPSISAAPSLSPAPSVSAAPTGSEPPSSAPTVSAAPSVSAAPTTLKSSKSKGSKSSKSSKKSSKKGGAKGAKNAKMDVLGEYIADGSKGSKSNKSLKSFKGSKKSAGGEPIPVKSSAYVITYSALEVIPTAKDLEQLAKVTADYLEDFMEDFFKKTALTDIDDFMTVMVRDVFVKGEPVIAEYQSNGVFDADSIFVPVTKEMDNLIGDAISRDAYLDALSKLPKSNPFRDAKVIAFTESDGTETTLGGGEGSSTGTGSSFVTGGVAAAAAGVLVLAASLAILKRGNRSFDDEDIQSLTPRKLQSEDLTTAADSFGDASFSHWKASRSYSDVGEFQDEPL